MFDKFLQDKGISKEAFNNKSTEEMQALYKEFMNSVGEKIDKAANKDDFDVLKETFNTLNEELGGFKGEQLTKALDAIEELNGEITKMKEHGGKNPEKSLHYAIKEQIEDVKKIAKGTSRGKDVVIKANVTRASIANNTEAIRLTDIGQLGVKRRALYDYFSKFPVSTGNHNGTITYIDWDEDTIARAADIVAEGGSFPESTVGFAEYTKKLQKVGDTLPVSEEFGEDEVLAAAELDNFLRVNVSTKIDQKLATGAGGANDIEGLYTAAPTYTAVASSIADANIKDLVRKMRTAIVKTRGSKYNPNFVAANSDVIDQYILKKDANNNYMFDMNTGQIAGLDIVEDNNLSDNTLVVGDGRFGRIYEMAGITLSEGYKNEQFTDDFKTIKARMRLLFLIREVDKTGFLKSTSISADLTTLASS